MKSRPILFSAPMIRAILSGTKTQTRRVVSMRDSSRYKFRALAGLRAVFDLVGPVKTKVNGEVKLWMRSFGVNCRYGQVGDQLWCRETFAPRGVAVQPDGVYHAVIEYRADNKRVIVPHEPAQRMVGDWKPSIFMPRWASRITLEIVDVRVERLHDISEEDARAEGIRPFTFDVPPNPPGQVITAYGTENYYPKTEPTPAAAYRRLWESINSAGAWALNPWVWAISFRRL